MPTWFFPSRVFPSFHDGKIHQTGGTSLIGSCGEYWATSRRVCAASTAGAPWLFSHQKVVSDLIQPMVILANFKGGFTDVGYKNC